MTSQVQFRKGTDSQSNAFTGALAEVTVDTTTKTLRVHDGATPGGSELVNLSSEQTLESKTINALTLTGSLTANSSTGSSGQYLESTSDGVQWSNIDTASISNGNSSVSVTESANVTVSITDTVAATFSTGGLVLAGNLTVNGTTTTVNSNEVAIGDSIIDLNADISSGTAPTANAGITVIRGSEANKSLLWNEATDKWSVETETFVAGTFEGNLSGNVTGQVSDISNHSTTDLSEGTNLYYTDTRARNALSASGDLTYNSTTGEFSVVVPAGYDSSDFNTDFSGKSTSDLSEGTNLYYTDTRARSAISASGDLTYNSSTGVVSFTERTDSEVRSLISASGDLSYNSTTGEFSVTTFKSSDFDTNFSGKSTTDLSEGTNIYYIDTRANSAIDARVTKSFVDNLAIDASTLSNKPDPTITLAGDLTGNVTLTNLGNGTLTATIVDDSHNHVISNVDGLQSALDNKADESISLSAGNGLTGGGTLSSNRTFNIGAGTGINVNANDIDVDTSVIATRSYVDTEVSGLVDSAPATLDTLNELAAALGDDPDFATTISNQIGNKANNSTTISAGTGLTGGGSLASNRTISHADTSSVSNVAAASNTFIDAIAFDTFGHVQSVSTSTAAPPNDASITVNAGSGLTGGGTFTVDQSFNETITVNHSDTSSQGSVNNSGTTVIQDITLDTFGHITNINSKSISRTDLGIDTNDSVTFGAITVPSIAKSGTDGVGNIGSSANSFNTVHAKATSAQYADVAENYVSDDSYTPGTVVVIGGTEEVTISSKYADSKLAGVITTNPALLMNDNLQSEYIAPIALTGRVPCAVVGTIKKGDILTTSHIAGVATRLFNEDFVPGCVIGKALQEHDGENPGIIEVLVGKV